MTDVGGLLRAERSALVELLEGLSPEEWAAPSLCRGWTVQDVAAHVAWMPVLPASQAVRELGRSRLRINRMIQDTAVRWSARGVGATLDQLRNNVRTGATPVGTSPIIGLADAVIHQLDIRRPLNRPRPIPREAFVTVAELQVAVRWPSTVVVGGNPRRRIQGVQLIADDVGWSHGSGEVVRGSPEALLLMLTGRPFRPDELTGPGIPRLRTSR